MITEAKAENNAKVLLTDQLSRETNSIHVHPKKKR